MASLDVELLFTNIFFEETTKNCVNSLFSNHVYSGKLTKKDLNDLLKLQTTQFLTTNFMKKLTELQWLYIYVPHWLMYFFSIMKKFVLIDALPNLNL